MKTLHWDAINPFTGRPFTWDDPNLRWGDPAYYLEPGDPGFVPYGPPPPAPKPKKKKPFRRAPRPEPQPEPTTTPTMSTFKYNVAPKSSGGFTTRAVRGNPETSTEILNHVATQAGITTAQAETALRAFFAKILDTSCGCNWSPDFLGILSFRPTSGGSSPTPDGFHNADDINADVALSFTAETIRQWRSTLTLESMGEVGKITPVIETILRQSDLAVDKYTPGGLIELRGDYMNLKPSDTAQGVFFKPAAGAEVRATEYAGITPQSVIVLVPAALSGALTVRIATHINGSVRSHTYTNPLTTP